MSDGRGTFEHYRTFNGSVCRKITTRPVADRITTPAQRTKYSPEGFGLGAWVALPHGGTGQVWAKAPGQGYWWVAAGERGFIKMHESNTYLSGHAAEDAPLFEDVAS